MNEKFVPLSIHHYRNEESKLNFFNEIYLGKSPIVTSHECLKAQNTNNNKYGSMTNVSEDDITGKFLINHA